MPDPGPLLAHRAERAVALQDEKGHPPLLQLRRMSGQAGQVGVAEFHRVADRPPGRRRPWPQRGYRRQFRLAEPDRRCGRRASAPGQALARPADGSPRCRRHRGEQAVPAAQIRRGDPRPAGDEEPEGLGIGQDVPEEVEGDTCNRPPAGAARSPRTAAAALSAGGEVARPVIGSLEPGRTVHKGTASTRPASAFRRPPGRCTRRSPGGAARG